MPTFRIGDLMHGFRVERAGEIPLMNAGVWKLTHEKTGATLYYSDRDDGQMVFSVGFRTLPENDTGVFHILEHSSLDGSEHFPLKEPFVNLIKTSMSVDLNAMTYEDKTIYYFISTNEKDFMNMMSVYLDAVLHPLLLTDRRIFEKEAWHLEPDGKGGLNCSGVVFNEMQGTENQPDNAMWFQAEKQVYPDLFNRFNSGGDPAYIHDLTYEKFKETYERFYGVDNAVIYLSGKLGLDEELAYIDGVLSSHDAPKFPRPAPAPAQKPVVSPEGTVYYQLPENEQPETNTHLMLTYIIGGERGTSPEDVAETDCESLAFALLSRYLCENTEAPLSKAVLDADVGQDFGMNTEGDYRQPMVYFTMGRSDPEKAEGFRAVILDTLTRLVSEGLDRDRLNALLLNHETDCRRASLSVRSGWRIMESVIRSHVMYGDAILTDGLAALRAHLEADPQYFEHLITKYILHSEHWALTKCVPSRTVTSERKAKMDAWLAAEAEKLHAKEGAYEALEAHFAAFNQYLVAPDSPEAEATIPHLMPSDVDPKLDIRDVERETTPVGGAAAESLKYIADTNGMVNARLIFDLRGLQPDDLFYANLLTQSLFTLPTAAHTVPELTDLWVKLRTNPMIFTSASKNLSTGEAVPTLTIVLDAPEESLPDAVTLLGEYLSASVFDPVILRRLFSNASDIRSGMVRRGNSTAVRLALGCLSVQSRYDDLMSGVSAFRRSCRLADHFDDEADALIAGLSRVTSHLFREVVPTAAFVGGETACAAWYKAAAGLPLASALPAQPVRYTITPRERAARALTIPGQVNYCAEVYDLAAVGETYSAKMGVVTSCLYSKYFWDEIRAKGGAYGASAFVDAAGTFAMSSYRDPRVGDTYNAFSRVADWLDANVPGDDELGSLIVSSLSGFFAPASPLDRGNAAIRRVMSGTTADTVRKNMADTLATTADDFRAFADMVRRLAASGTGVRAAVGGKARIEESGLFDEIEEL